MQGADKLVSRHIQQAEWVLQGALTSQAVLSGAP
jgi:hypothetical protein